MSDPLNPQGPTLPDSGLVQELQAEVTTETAPLLMFILKNIRVLVGSILLLVFVIIGTGTWRWYTAQQTEEAQIELGRMLVRTEGAARVTALQDMLKDAPESVQIAILFELASSAIAVEQYDVAATSYGALVLRDPEGALGIMACINQIDVLLREDKALEALVLLDVLERKAPEMLQVMVQETIANVAEQAGDFDRALLAYEKLLQFEDLAGDTGYFEARIKTLRVKASR